MSNPRLDKLKAPTVLRDVHRRVVSLDEPIKDVRNEGEVRRAEVFHLRGWTRTKRTDVATAASQASSGSCATNRYGPRVAERPHRLSKAWMTASSGGVSPSPAVDQHRLPGYLLLSSLNDIFVHRPRASYARAVQGTGGRPQRALFSHQPSPDKPQV